LLKEIIIHGRGGQGAVTAAQLLAHAAFLEGKWVQAFPYFGAERRGAPVKAFARISDEPILMHSQIYNPNYVIILSSELTRIVNVTEGLKKGGLILMNTTKKPEETNLNGQRTATIDATGIAIELGLLVAGFPVVNTAIVGAFAKATSEIKLESFLKTIRETWSGTAGEKNAKAAEFAYERLIKGW
jgi:2-oxoacid:acceptor oxidoreductase gamma subunit (pyruvate/2-ketoisovalerate family)